MVDFQRVEIAAALPTGTNSIGGVTTAYRSLGKTRIATSQAAVNGTVTVYTVPADKVAYITHVDLWYASTVSTGIATVNIAGAEMLRLTSTITGTYATVEGKGIVTNPTEPFILVATETITVASNDASLTAGCHVWGWLEDA